MLYKKNLFVVALTFTVFLMALFTNAQTIIVVLKQPPPNQWHVEDMWQLTLTNTSQKSYNVYLYGTVEEAGAGMIFEGTSAMFDLPPNFSGPVNPGDLEPIDVGYTNGDYEEIVMRTGTLPAGTYTICVYAKSVYGEVMGYDCKMQIIAHPSPPELINPVDEANVTEELPVFLWLPPMPMGEFVTYNIKLVELLNGQTLMEAMEANPAWFEETEIFSTSFQFPISAREFEQGVTYAWKVTAISGDGLVIGESQVWSFNYGAAGVVLYEEPVSIELNYPIDGAVIDTTSPTFKWEPIDTTSVVTVTWTTTPEISYNLEIWKLPKDLAERVVEGYTLTEGDIVDLELVSIMEGITVTTFTPDHDGYVLDLVPDFTYGWQVTTWSGEWGIGRSEVNTFYLKTQEIGEIVLDHFIPDTLFSGTESEAILVGKGFIEGMGFEVPYEGIDVTDAQFQDSEHYLIDFKIASDVAPGHYIFQVKTVIGKTKPIATALNVTDEDCKEILKDYKALQDKIKEKQKDCEELQKKVNKLQAEKNVAERERNAKKKNRDDAKKAFNEAKGKLEKLIDSSISSDEVSRKEDNRKNWIGLCGSKVKIWFTGTDASIDVLLLFLKSSPQIRLDLQKECRDADKKLAEAEKALAKAENKLNEINQKLRNAKDALDKCLQEKGEMEKELKKLGEKHKQCLKRLGEQNESQDSIDKAKRELAKAEAQIKAAEEKIKEVKRKLNPKCKTAKNLLKKAEELLKQAKEKAKKAKAAIMRAEEQLKKGCLKNVKKHLEELEPKPKDPIEEAKALSGSAIDKAIDAESKIEKCKEEAPTEPPHPLPSEPPQPPPPKPPSGLPEWLKPLWEALKYVVPGSELVSWLNKDTACNILGVKLAYYMKEWKECLAKRDFDDPKCKKLEETCKNLREFYHKHCR